MSGLFDETGRPTVELRPDVCKLCHVATVDACSWERSEKLDDMPPGWKVTRRPRTCAKGYDPATSPWPDGF